MVAVSLKKKKKKGEKKEHKEAKQEAEKTDPSGYLIKHIDVQKLKRTLDKTLSDLRVSQEKSQVLHRLNRAVTHRNIQTTQIMTLLNASAMINSSLRSYEINRKTIESAMLLVDAEAASLLFVDETTGKLYFDVALGEKGDDIRTMHIPMGEGIAGWVACHREPLIINDPQKDSRFKGDMDKKVRFVTRNLICLPVITKGKLLGVLEVINKRHRDFDRTDMDLLSALSNQIAVAIDNSKLYEEIKTTLYSIMYSLAETIEKRDPYTGGHARRVRDYSLQTGQELGLSDQALSELEIAAILHDIGKIGVDDDILRKKDKLTDVEYAAMKQHPVIGEEILRHVPGMKSIIPGVRHHHERYDGKGYPDGLQGEEIDMLARIISVTDTFDAMTSDRSYRERLDTTFAMDELRKNAGTQFDPVIVETFIRCCDQGLNNDSSELPSR